LLPGAANRRLRATSLSQDEASVPAARWTTRPCHVAGPSACLPELHVYNGHPSLPATAGPLSSQGRLTGESTQSLVRGTQVRTRAHVRDSRPRIDDPQRLPGRSVLPNRVRVTAAVWTIAIAALSRPFAVPAREQMGLTGLGTVAVGRPGRWIRSRRLAAPRLTEAPVLIAASGSGEHGSARRSVGAWRSRGHWRAARARRDGRGFVLFTRDSGPLVRGAQAAPP
jgi:hypothetical protein